MNEVSAVIQNQRLKSTLSRNHPSRPSTTSEMGPASGTARGTNTNAGISTGMAEDAPDEVELLERELKALNRKVKRGEINAFAALEERIRIHDALAAALAA